MLWFEISSRSEKSAAKKGGKGEKGEKGEKGVKLVLRNSAPIRSNAGSIGEQTNVRNVIDTVCRILGNEAEEAFLSRVPLQIFGRFRSMSSTQFGEANCKD